MEAKGPGQLPQVVRPLTPFLWPTECGVSSDVEKNTNMATTDLHSGMWTRTVPACSHLSEILMGRRDCPWSRRPLVLFRMETEAGPDDLLRYPCVLTG